MPQDHILLRGTGLGGWPSPETLSDRLQEQLRSLENIELQSASSFTRCFPYRQRCSRYRNASSHVNIKQIFHRFIHLHICIY